MMRLTLADCFRCLASIIIALLLALFGVTFGVGVVEIVRVVGGNK